MNFNTQIKFLNSLTHTEKELIKRYTGYLYKEVRESFMKNEYNKEVSHIIETLDNIFERIPPVKHSFIVYRGIKDKLTKDIQSYVSTSLDKNVALEFMGEECCFLEITVSAGSKILPLFVNSRYASEQEILLSRFGKFEITYENFGKYFLTYLPDDHIIISKKTPEIKIINFSFETWIRRLENAISKEELDLFDNDIEKEEYIQSLFTEKIPIEAITSFLEI